MTAVTIPQSDDVSVAANAWLSEHHQELTSRAKACFARRRPEQREEAVAEVIAMVAAAAHRAAAGGKLENLTPYHCVYFASKHVRIGRRMCGYSSTDVTSEAARITRGLRVHSFDSTGKGDDGNQRPWRAALADRDGADPADVARRRLDYATLLADASVSEKAKATFMFLASTRGDGKQGDLAAELLVSPGRITQLKGELARALTRYGYHGPLGPRPSKR